MWETVFKPFSQRECFTVFPTLLKPRSVGYIQLKSTNPYDHPMIEPNYYHHPDDLDSMAEAMGLIYQMIKSPAFRRFNVVPSDIVVPGMQFPIYRFSAVI